MAVAPQPPYSSDLASVDCELFPELKMKLNARSFATVPDIQRESKTVFDIFRENDLRSAFQKWNTQ